MHDLPASPHDLPRLSLRSPRALPERFGRARRGARTRATRSPARGRHPRRSGRPRPAAGRRRHALAAPRSGEAAGRGAAAGGPARRRRARRSLSAPVPRRAGEALLSSGLAGIVRWRTDLRPADRRWLGLADDAPRSEAAGGPATAALAEGRLRTGERWCLLAGELHDRTVLAQRLGESPEAPAEALAQAAFEHRGERAPELLVGDWAVAQWDGERLLLVRDALGVESLFWAELADGVAFASHAERLLAHPEVPDDLDVESIAGHLAGWSDEPDRSYFAAARAVPPGHRLRFDPSVRRLERWWHPRELAGRSTASPSRPLSPVDRREAAERLWSLLVRAVADRLPPDGGPVAVLGSGGLDSSTVAAAAVEAGAEVRLLSYVLPGVAEADEEAYAAALVEHLALERIVVDALAHPPFEGDVSPRARAPFFGWDGPITAGLRALRHRGIQHAFTGYGGDDLFAGSRSSLLGRLAAGEGGLVAELVAAGRDRAMGPARALYRYLIEPHLPLGVEVALRRVTGRRPLAGWPSWLTPALVREGRLHHRWREYESQVRRGGVDAVAALLAAAPWASGVDWYRELAGREAVRVAHPLIDRRLVELLLELPPALLYDPGDDRPLLRGAGRGRLPELVRRRRSKARLGAFLDHSLRGRREWVDELLRDLALSRRGWIDPGPLRAAAEAMLAGTAVEEDRLAWTTLTVELWLRRRPWRPGPDESLTPDGKQYTGSRYAL